MVLRTCLASDVDERHADVGLKDPSRPDGCECGLMMVEVPNLSLQTSSLAKRFLPSLLPPFSPLDLRLLCLQVRNHASSSPEYRMILTIQMPCNADLGDRARRPTHVADLVLGHCVAANVEHHTKLLLLKFGMVSSLADVNS